MDEPTTTTTDPNAELALSVEELQEAWPVMSVDERIEAFRLLPREDAEEFFLSVHPRDQVDLVLSLRPPERRSWIRMLAPDDAADLIQEMPKGECDALLGQLDEQTRREVCALMAYDEDVAGGLMNPRYARLRPEATVDEAISYLRRQTRENIETLAHVFVLDAQQKLLGVVDLIELFKAPGSKKISEIMQTDFFTIPENLDQEKISQLFSQNALTVVPVVDEQGCMKGIVTIDDIVDVVQEEATEDAQKFGGMEALGEPYLEIGLLSMVKKRAGWLSILCVSEMLTATVMGYYETAIQQVVALSLFIPLIMSNGGNSGSQASTLVIRAMALGEVRLRDWWRVARREMAAGAMLGLMMGLLGFTRISLWPSRATLYGEHYMMIALTVACAQVGVVLFGSMAGSMLPFILRRCGFDPASASAPFVATLVDVTGLVIYFTAASIILHQLFIAAKTIPPAYTWY